MTWGFAVQGRQTGRFRLLKQPWDLRAPYGIVLVTPDGRHYRGRARSHIDHARSRIWYEGFVTALSPADYARDEALKRYPERPRVVPRYWDLFPCQLKLNQAPQRIAPVTDLIGEVWVSSRASAGGEIFRLLAEYREDEQIVCEGAVLWLTNYAQAA